MLDVQISKPSVPSAPFSIDTSKGGLDSAVSNQWMNRPDDQIFNNLDDLYDFKKGVYDGSFSGVAKSGGIEMIAPEPESREDLHKMSVGVSYTEPGSDIARTKVVAPTHWAFGQICTLVKAQGAYLRRLPSQISAKALNWDLQYIRAAEEIGVFGGDDLLYAATGPAYGRIPDHEVVEAVMQIAGAGLGRDGYHWKTPGKIDWNRRLYDPENIGPRQDHTFYGSDRDMFIFLVDDRRPILVGKTRDGRDDYMFRGFYVQNSMVGSKALKLTAFYLRGVCMNRNIWGQQEVESITLRHTSIAPDRWMKQCLPALKSYAESSESNLLEQVGRLKRTEVVSSNEECVEFLKKRNFSFKAIQDVMSTHEKEEGAPIRTAWDMVQGITAHARDHGRFQDERLRIEMEAQKIADRVV